MSFDFTLEDAGDRAVVVPLNPIALAELTRLSFQRFAILYRGQLDVAWPDLHAVVQRLVTWGHTVDDFRAPVTR
jgi:hypothetical protein